jgi:hypothetical protein
VPLSDRKKHEKKVSDDEKEITRLQQAMQQSKMKSTIFMSLTYFLIFNMLSTSYDGIRVARLPFYPFGIVQGLSHRNLQDDDMTDCSVVRCRVFARLVCFCVRGWRVIEPPPQLTEPTRVRGEGGCGEGCD